MSDARADILAMLDDIERSEHVRILWAGEAGSRAWGTALPESDYDVRFVYVRTLEAYLSLEPNRKDTITWHPNPNGALDVSGWDLRKYLQLAHKGNVSVFEWGASSVVYRTEPAWRDVWNAAQPYFSCKAALSSYQGIAASTCKKSLQPGSERVPCKEYLRVLRSLLACRFIAEYGTRPPVRFADLVSRAASPAVAEATTRLVQQRTDAGGQAMVARIRELDAFIEDALPRFGALARTMPDDRKPERGPLDRVFRFVLDGEASR